MKGGRGPFSEIGVETAEDEADGVTGALPLPARLADLAMLSSVRAFLACLFFVLLCLVSGVLISALDASKPYRGQYAGSRCCICVPNAICITVVVYRSDQSSMDGDDDDDRFR